jgi:hypothetical protein
MALLVFAAPAGAAVLLLVLQRIELWMGSGDSPKHRHDSSR